MPTITVDIINETDQHIDQFKTDHVTRQHLGELPDREWHVTIRFVSDSGIELLNKKHLSKNYPTDVLSFPVFSFDKGKPPVLPPGPLDLGEVVVNLEQATRQAKLARQNQASEVQSLIAHGIGHLIGFHHE